MYYAVKFSETKTNSGKFIRPTFVNNHTECFWPEDAEAKLLLSDAVTFLRSIGVICNYTKIQGNYLESYQCFTTPEQALAQLPLKKDVCNFINIYDTDLNSIQTENYLYQRFLAYSKYRFNLVKTMYGVYQVNNHTEMYQLTDSDLVGYVRLDF